MNKQKQTRRYREQQRLLEWKKQGEDEMGKGDQLYAERWKINFWW